MSSANPAVFNRPELAARLVAELLEPSAASPVRSGLFLAAPRRTGKSTFLIADLVPALLAAGAYPLYLDLREGPTKDPARSVAGAVSAWVGQQTDAVNRLANKFGRTRTASAAGAVRVSRSDGSVIGVSLTQAFLALSNTIECTLVLIVDEAQRAVASETGPSTLFALEAARDALNIARPHGLRIVATGSNRDKLSMLRSGPGQAFDGAPLRSFPPLGEDYVRWALERRGLSDALDPSVAVDLFDRCGHQPERLGAALDELDRDVEIDGDALASRLETSVEALLREADLARLRQVTALTALQGAVLHEMASAGDTYAPFHAETRKRHARAMSDSAEVPDESSVQRALVELQKKGFVWRTPSGVYGLEDGGLVGAIRGWKARDQSCHDPASGS